MTDQEKIALLGEMTLPKRVILFPRRGPLAITTRSMTICISVLKNWRAQRLATIPLIRTITRFAIFN